MFKGLAFFRWKNANPMNMSVAFATVAAKDDKKFDIPVIKLSSIFLPTVLNADVSSGEILFKNKPKLSFTFSIISDKYIAVCGIFFAKSKKNINLHSSYI